MSRLSKDLPITLNQFKMSFFNSLAMRSLGF